jgi:hypothetical protein
MCGRSWLQQLPQRLLLLQQTAQACCKAPAGEPLLAAITLLPPLRWLQVTLRAACDSLLRVRTGSSNG